MTTTCRSSHPSFYDLTFYHRPGDRLACGNARDDHDHLGHCATCEYACGERLCIAHDDAIEHDGLAYHKDCLLLDRRIKVASAIKALLHAATELNRVDEEALILPADPSEDEQCNAYDAIDMLRRWATRNKLEVSSD